MVKEYSSISAAFQTGALCDMSLNTCDPERISVVLEGQEGILLLKHVIFAPTSYKSDKTGELLANIHSRREYFELPYVMPNKGLISNLSVGVAEQLNEKYGIEISGEVDVYLNASKRKFGYFDTNEFTFDVETIKAKTGAIDVGFYDKEQFERLASRENAISLIPSYSL